MERCFGKSECIYCQGQNRLAMGFVFSATNNTPQITAVMYAIRIEFKNPQLPGHLPSKKGWLKPTVRLTH